VPACVFNKNVLALLRAASKTVCGAGWTVGAGVEAAFGGGWSWKVEYLYIDLGKLEQTLSTFSGTETFNSRVTDNIVRVGLNYRWGGYGGGYGGGY
jgi:outer membrane immunogenic protein